MVVAAEAVVGKLPLSGLAPLIVGQLLTGYWGLTKF